MLNLFTLYSFGNFFWGERGGQGVGVFVLFRICLGTLEQRMDAEIDFNLLSSKKRITNKENFISKVLNLR